MQPDAPTDPGAELGPSVSGKERHHDCDIAACGMRRGLAGTLQSRRPDTV